MGVRLTPYPRYVRSDVIVYLGWSNGHDIHYQVEDVGSSPTPRAHTAITITYLTYQMLITKSGSPIAYASERSRL